MRWLLALAALAGCDQVFGIDHHAPHGDADVTPPADIARDGCGSPDLDGDCIADDEDPCISSPADGMDDEDSDGLANAMDPCPFNPAATSDTDIDGDGIPDVCDPFPSEGGDMARCYTSFASQPLDAVLWRGRTGEPAWATVTNGLEAQPSGTETWTAVAAESFEGSITTTYDAVFTFDSQVRPGSLTLWLRANPAAPDTNDVGCQYSGGGTMAIIGPNGAKDPHVVPFNAAVPHFFRIRGSITTVAPTGTNVQVTCRFKLDTSTEQTASALVPLPAGNVGFSAEHWKANALAIQVSDRTN